MTVKSGQVLAVIPARLASTRLPAKPLKDIAGKSLLQRVWERARAAQTVDRVVIATDAEEIRRSAAAFGAEVIMTGTELSTGSERVYTAARMLDGGGSPWRLVVNVQGDMPFISPALIDRAVGFMLENSHRFGMTTVATPIFSEDLFLSRNVVKVVVGEGERGLFFSRAPIPWSRDGDRTVDRRFGECFGFKHLGLYVFSPEALTAYSDSNQSSLESVEKLEQLRLLERGYPVGVCVVEPELVAGSVEVDTAEDLAAANKVAKEKGW